MHINNNNNDDNNNQLLSKQMAKTIIKVLMQFKEISKM